jgi:hypothetical protein
MTEKTGSKITIIMNTLLYALLLTAVPALSNETGENCRPGSHTLYWKISPDLDSNTHQGFQQNLMQGLGTQLSEIGYCLDTLSAWEELQQSEEAPESRVLQITAGLPEKDRPGVLLKAAVIRARGATPERMKEGFTRPLMTLAYSAEEPQSIERVVVQKIIENLKDKFICHLLIKSKPEWINFHIDKGLNGVTPVEWVIPVGRLSISADEKGFLPFHATIELETPGEHEYLIKLKKKRFYHSKMMIPFIAGALASGVSYYMQSYYYDQYSGLGKWDLDNKPESFSEKFGKAKTWERITAGSLIATGFFFSLSFWF